MLTKITNTHAKLVGLKNKTQAVVNNPLLGYFFKRYIATPIVLGRGQLLLYPWLVENKVTVLMSNFGPIPTCGLLSYQRDSFGEFPVLFTVRIGGSLVLVDARVFDVTPKILDSGTSSSEGQVEDQKPVVIYALNRDVSKVTKVIESIIDPDYDQPNYCEYDENGYETLRGRISSKYSRQKILIPQHKVDEIESRILRVMNEPEYYEENDIPRKETLLVYGPPGTAKSSCIRTLASRHGLDLISLPSIECIRAVPPNTTNKTRILLVEDIHTNKVYQVVDQSNPVENRVQAHHHSHALRVGMQTLDGQRPLHNDVIILTANNADTLNRALIRPGRVNARIHIGYLTTELFFEYIGWSEDDPRRIRLNDLLDHNMLTAALVSHFKRCKTVEEVNSAHQLNLIIEAEETEETMHLNKHSAPRRHCYSSTPDF